jgi:ferritin-like metal-binding protein YciE
MEDLFVDGVKDIYYAERKIVAALKKMICGSKA